MNMTYSVAGGYGGGQITLGGVESTRIQGPQTITLQITPANGGTVVSVRTHGAEELHVIADDANFDTELGKIITHHRLKHD